jgi:RND family efflux transporter MFP subunit
MHRTLPFSMHQPPACLSVLRFSALAVTILVGACKKPAAAPPPGPLPVNVVAAVEREVVEWDEFTGRIEPVEFVEIRPRVSGYITQVHFTASPDTQVKKGDLLFTIDPRPYQAEFDRAEAEVKRAEAATQLADIDFKRAQELLAKKTISSSEYDQKIATLNQAKASLAAATAAREAAQLNLEFTEIRSPIDGRISDERVKVGNLVQPGAGPEAVLTTVVSVDPFYVYVDTDENRLLKYIKLDAEGKLATARKAKRPAYIELGNETGFPHEGYVDFIDNRLDPNTGTLRARAVFKNWSPLVTPGFFVRLRIMGGPTGNAVLVPDRVVSSEQGMKYVFVVKPDSTLERRNLTTGSVIDGERVVRSGLKAGEQVISTRLQMLRPGMPVKPIPEAPPAAAPAPASETPGAAK